MPLLDIEFVQPGAAGDVLATQALALAQVLAIGPGCAPERVHLQYAPDGAGRQAFGGVIVR